MLDAELKAELDAIRQTAEAARVSAEKTRKYILWSAVLGAAVIILPLLFLPFAVNSLFSTYSSALSF